MRKKEDLEAICEGGRILASVLRAVVAEVGAGVSTGNLDEIAEAKMREVGGVPAFKGYKAFGAAIPFPGTLCTSVNDVVVHGIPSPHAVLARGDIVGIDIGMKYKGFYTDMAVTVPVGKVSPESQKLIDVTKRSLDIAIQTVRAGIRTGDIGAAVQIYVEENGFSIVRDLVGHGIGKKLHEDPVIPNFGKPNTGDFLEEGMLIAVEPMVAAGGWRVKIDDDDWTWRTRDGSRAAHFEHTILVTGNGAEVLTL